MIQRLWIPCLVLALGMGIARGQLITNLERTNGQNGEPQLAPEGLEVGGPVFVDRTHRYIVLSEFLLGLEYAMLANNDKVDSDFKLHVTLARSATLYLFLDTRIGDNNGDNPPALGGSVMQWVIGMGFTTTYELIGVDEKGTGVPNGWYTVYKLDVPAGTITLFEQNDGGARRMYNVAVWAPSLTADHPRPEDGAVDVPVDTMLAWTPGANAGTQDVYFGTAFDDVSSASRACATWRLPTGRTALCWMPGSLRNSLNRSVCRTWIDVPPQENGFWQVRVLFEKDLDLYGRVPVSLLVFLQENWPIAAMARDSSFS